VTAIERWFNTGPRGDAVYGRLRALAVGPDGAIYVGTSNYDGRGQPLSSADDRVLRIAPARSRPSPRP
jgi:glucose/arabinose dehydrogenase